jgi:hypothetical protein
MVEGAMHRFEEDAAIGAILLVGEPRRGIVQPLVAQAL